MYFLKYHFHRYGPVLILSSDVGRQLAGREYTHKYSLLAALSAIWSVKHHADSVFIPNDINMRHFALPPTFSGFQHLLMFMFMILLKINGITC